MKDRLLTTDEIKKYHWIYISPASIETTIAILEEQDKKSIAANNAKWREKIEEYFRVPEWDYSERGIVISVDDWQSILSEMGKEGE